MRQEEVENESGDFLWNCAGGWRMILVEGYQPWKRMDLRSFFDGNSSESELPGRKGKKASFGYCSGVYHNCVYFFEMVNHIGNPFDGWSLNKERFNV